MTKKRGDSFTQERCAAICNAIAHGSSLRKACAAQGTTHSTFLRWLDEREDLANQYARAREDGYRLLADEIIEISDDSAGDVITDEDGNEITNSERVARSKLRVDSRKWMLSKMLPKVYGDRLNLDHSGGIAVSGEVRYEANLPPRKPK